ncbi:MAG: Na/Pi cotransporter family protein [Chromatiales bacterium]|nr:Na/Pi cotransporter family protein [Chromatiales bacterium]
MTNRVLASCRRTSVRVALGMGLGIALWMFAAPGVAATGGAGLDWAQMLIQLAGGLALFLFGMDQMGEALKVVAGDKMRQILGKLTTNRVMGLVTGTVVTAIIQSSSVTTVMLVGFVTANLMSLSQAIGVILGADIGTTITAQIVAFPVKEYALLLVAAGFLMTLTGKREDIRQYGILVMGLGLIFFGMAVMSGAMKPLRSYQPFIDLMQNVSNPLVGILVSTAFTALVQSSSATMGIVIVLASQGLISLEGGIALALGANIGTCATAGLAALGKPREAVRVAVAHVTFKIAGVLLIVWFIPPFADLVRNISPVSEHLTGMDRLAADTPRQVANAHTLFNVGIGFLFLPLAGVFARFCEWVVPDRPLTEAEELDARHEPKYLDQVLLDTPALALERAQLEIGRLGDRVSDMYEAFLEPTFAHDTARLEEIAEMDVDVDMLHAQIVEYLARISSGELSRKETDALIRLMQAANQIEHMGDLIETNLVGLGQKLAEDGVAVSPVTAEIIRDYHQKVGDALRESTDAFRESDAKLARRVRRMKPEMTEMARHSVRHALDRLVADEPNRLQAYTREMELIENLTRIFRHSRRLAGLVAP